LLYKWVGILLLNLNINDRPIAKKYCEGNLKRIEKSMLKEYEIGKNGTEMGVWKKND